MQCLTDEPDPMQEWYQSIGSNIMWYRRQRGLTQEALADWLGISRAHLAAIEAPNSKRRPSMTLIYRISTVLNVDPGELLKMRAAPPREV